MSDHSLEVHPHAMYCRPTRFKQILWRHAISSCVYISKVKDILILAVSSAYAWLTFQGKVTFVVVLYELRNNFPNKSLCRTLLIEYSTPESFKRNKRSDDDMNTIIKPTINIIIFILFKWNDSRGFECYFFNVENSDSKNHCVIVH